MSLGATIFLAASLFTAGPLGNVELTSDVRSETRMRIVEEEDGPTITGRDRELLELGIVPRLLLANNGRLRLSLTYAPSLRVPYESLPSEPVDGEIYEDDRVSFQHNLSLLANREVQRWSLRAGAAASYGFYDPLDREQAQAGQPLLSTSRLPFQGYSLTAGFTHQTWQRTSLAVDAGVSTSGGDGPMARAELPVQNELRLSSVLDHDANPRDSYAALLTVVATDVEGGDSAQTVEAGGRWTHELNPRHSLQLGGGAALALVQDEGAAHQRAGPWAHGSWAYIPAPQLPSLVVTVGGVPAVDRLSGSLSYRAYADARTAWAPFRAWRFELGAGGALLEPWLGFDDMDATSTWMGTASARAEWTLTTRLLLGAGLASLWQDSGRPDLVSFRELVATVDLMAILIR